MEETKKVLSNQYNRQNTINSKYVYFSLSLLTLFLIESQFRILLFDYSVVFVKWLHVEALSKNSFVYSIAEFLSILPRDTFMIYMFLIIYNYFNLYKTFIFIVSHVVHRFGVSFLKMIFQSPRPYWMLEPGFTQSCEGGFGNPSGHSFGSMLMGLTLYEIFVNSNKTFKKQKVLKYMILSLTFVLIISIALSRVVLGVHSFNQILFGCILGLFFYFLIFKIILDSDDLNNPEVMKTIVESKNTLFISLLTFSTMLAMSLLSYFVLYDQQYESQFLQIFNNQCSKIPKYKRMSNESLFEQLSALVFIGMIFGILCDYNYNFNSNTKQFIDYNFNKYPEVNGNEYQGEYNQVPSEDQEVNNQIIYIQDQNSNDTTKKEEPIQKWNDSTLILALIRCLFTFVFIFSILFIASLIPNDSSLILLMACKFTVPMTIILFYLFFINKQVTSFIGISNKIPDNIQQDEISK